MRKLNLEIAVGLFMVAGFLCFAWLSVKLGDVDLFGPPTYACGVGQFRLGVRAKRGAIVEIAGVKVGKVAAIHLDPGNYDAMVDLDIDRGVALQEDSIASIRTAGIIGDRYVDISPGGSEKLIGPGGRIVETESAINLEQLVSKYIFEKE